jgi:hypothetical protein
MKKSLRAWSIAVGIVVIFGFLYLGLAISLDRHGMGSADAAGWAQALGTVAAIAGTYWVGRFQAETARLNGHEIDEKKLARKHSALCAILDDAYEQCARLKATFKDADQAFGDLSFLLIFDERAFEDAIKNVESISLHELDSYIVVRAVSKFRNRLISIRGHVIYAMDRNRDKDESSDYAVKNHVNGLIADAEKEYTAAVAALGGNPLKEIAPFNY